MGVGVVSELASECGRPRFTCMPSDAFLCKVRSA
eukprot:CAMPEP_0118930716 /NCGR_PEP_ID=MMETSP1169-20130426/7307_1 /TAXON_ID=36882 /ORGANISM="Pyramimonas obovata, Strain CCMP722" /LENGTH=33 /DNA_ID= /DNA_START= /DNA_END= /DNA_ORIENTATION=